MDFTASVLPAPLSPFTIIDCPRPFVDNVSKTLKQGGKIQIIDSVGKLVFNQMINENQTINLSDLKVGVYFVKLNGSSNAIRIVIK